MIQHNQNNKQRLIALLLLTVYLPMVIATMTHTHANNLPVLSTNHYLGAILSVGDVDDCAVCQICSQTYTAATVLTLTTLLLFRPFVFHTPVQDTVRSLSSTPSLRAPPTRG